MRRALPMLVMGLLITPAAHAQNDDSLDSLLESGRLQASVQAATYHTDNFFNEDANEESALGALVSPRVHFTKETAKIQFHGTLDAEYGTFDAPGTTDDYTDATAGLRLSAQPTLRNQLSLNAGLRHGHDSFGVNRTEDATVRDRDLDRWNESTGGIHYRYGAPGARINVEGGLSELQRHYISNRSDTQFLNYDATTLQSALYYNYSPKTSALLDFAWTDYNFDFPFAGGPDQRGGDLYRIRTGVRWLATAKTSGDIRVGYRTRTFDDPASADVSGLDWEIGLKWSPASRTQFELTTARSEQQSYRSDAYLIDITGTTLGWTHTLSARTRAKARLEYLAVDFEGASRNDDIVGGSAGLEYMAMSYLWIVGNASMTNRDSSAPGLGYDRLSTFLGIRLGR